MTETDAEIPAVPASAPRRWDWRRGAKWFGAEFLVVVTGVLVALALNAWWADRQDRSKEQFYLRQLASDLAETERISAQRDQYMVPFERAPRRLAQAYFLADLPPRDSIVAWASVAPVHNPMSPVLGTVEAMVTTGDIGLIQDDSLRIAIVSYLDRTRSNIRGYHEWQQLLLEHTSAYGSHAPVAEVFAEQIGPGALDSLDRADSWRVLVPPSVDIEPFDVVAFVRDQRTQRLMVNMAATKDNMRLYRGYFRSDADALRERVEVALRE
ncbi:MAG: hypothetical protein HKN04_03360 [Rhodothermaceae bacterium]|nr:hypothetical protein [Rhodothermaceae bacterium]